MLGSLVQAILLISLILRGGTSLKFVSHCEWQKNRTKIFSTGFGAGIGAISVIVVSFIANNQIMQYCGAPSLAVYGVLGTVSALFLSMFSGVGQAVQPIAAENYGARKSERCWQAAGLGMRTAVFLGVIFTDIFIALPLEVTGFFMKMTDEVKEVAPYILRVYALSFVPLAVNIFIIYYLQATSRSRIASLISLGRGMILSGILLFAIPAIAGSNGEWWSICLAEILIAFGGTTYLTMEYMKFKRK